MANLTVHPVTPQDRIVASLPFVESVARRVAASMPHTIDLGDLVQDGMVGLIDAAHRYDDGRGIKFETFAERRVRGAMIDALRKDAWPRGVRRVSAASSRPPARHCAARPAPSRRWPTWPPASAPTRSASAAPSSASAPSSRRRLLSSSPDGPHDVEAAGRAACRPRRRRPTARYEASRDAATRVRRGPADAAAARAQGHRALLLPRRHDEADRGRALGVNESRISQLHARAIQRLQKAARRRLSPTTSLAAFQVGQRRAGRARWRPRPCSTPHAASGELRAPTRSRRGRRAGASTSRNGLGSQGQPLSSRKRSASVPATSPVTKITRRASAGVVLRDGPVERRAIQPRHLAGRR